MGGNGNQKTDVLIVEPDLIEQARLAVIAQVLGFSGHLFLDARDCLDTIPFTPYAIALISLDPKDIDSLAILKTIKISCLRAGRSTPIIALASNLSLDDRTRLVVGGVSDFLPKPVDVGTFQDVLWRWIPAAA